MQLVLQLDEQSNLVEEFRRRAFEVEEDAAAIKKDISGKEKRLQDVIVALQQLAREVCLRGGDGDGNLEDYSASLDEALSKVLGDIAKLKAEWTTVSQAINEKEITISHLSGDHKKLVEEVEQLQEKITTLTAITTDKGDEVSTSSLRSAGLQCCCYVYVAMDSCMYVHIYICMYLRMYVYI